MAALPSTASAGGLYLADRGARPLTRGGAFVAGADDPHSLWYNPGGMAFSGDQLLIDATLTFFEATYTRTDESGNPQPTVTGIHPYIPIPTIAGTFSIDELPEWTFGIGALTPNAVLAHWPSTVMEGGVELPAPQRYALITLEGSSLLPLAIGAAWRPMKELSIGLTGGVVLGEFRAQVALSACDGVICSFPEDPEYDATVEMAVPVAFPFFTLGGVVDLDAVRIGASLTTPVNLEGSALMRVRPPSAAAFDGARVVNRRDGCAYPDPCSEDTRADAQIELPWIVRLGVEWRPMPELRLEASVVWETWSVQDEARIAPRDVWIENALGGGLEYQVGPINIPRHMNDTVSVRLGGEYTIDRTVTVSVGGYFENSAISDEYLSSLTIDSDKVLIGAGVGIHVSPEVTIDVALGYNWLAPRTVRNSLVPQANPIRPPTSMVDTVYIGNGDYSMSAPYVGLGVRWRGDSGNIRGPGTEPAEEAPQEEAPEQPEADAPVESIDPPTTSEDPSVPWYLRGQSGGAQPAPEPEQPEAAPEPEEEERPARRRRRSR
jgi:long-chain fatty acid transport protein